MSTATVDSDRIIRLEGIYDDATSVSTLRTARPIRITNQRTRDDGGLYVTDLYESATAAEIVNVLLTEIDVVLRPNDPRRYSVYQGITRQLSQRLMSNNLPDAENEEDVYFQRQEPSNVTDAFSAFLSRLPLVIGENYSVYTTDNEPDEP